MALKYSRITEEEGEEGRILLRYFLPDIRTGYLRVGPEEVCMPDTYLKFSEAIRKAEIRDDDVWVMSHPKTGTTWIQEMAWCIANDLDFQRAKQNLQERCPFFEHCSLFNFTDVSPAITDLDLPTFVINSLEYVADMKSPRFIKCHLPWSLLPQQIQDGTKQPKIIYIWRNAKDTCISYYHHCKLLEGYEGNFEDFCTLFVGDSVAYSPFWSHVLGFWNRRHDPNILVLKYEDVKKDLPSAVRKTAEFLGKPLSEDQVNLLADHLSFESMKNNQSVNFEPVVEMCNKLGVSKGEGKFMRSGTVEEGKGKMNNEIIEKFNAWTKEKLQGTDLKL